MQVTNTVRMCSLRTRVRYEVRTGGMGIACARTCHESSAEHGTRDSPRSNCRVDCSMPFLCLAAHQSTSPNPYCRRSWNGTKHEHDQHHDQSHGQWSLCHTPRVSKLVFHSPIPSPRHETPASLLTLDAMSIVAVATRMRYDALMLGCDWCTNDWAR